MHSSLHNRLDQLDTRVQRIERTLHKGSGSSSVWRTFFSVLHSRNEESMARVGGWFVITMSILGLANDWVNDKAINVLFGISFGLGIWLLARSISLFDASGSAKQLYLQHSTGKAAHAHHLHQQPHHGVQSPTKILSFLEQLLLMVGGITIALVVIWAVNQYVANPFLRAIPFVIALLIGLYYALAKNRLWLTYCLLIGLYGFLLLVQAPLSALTGLLVITIVFAAYAAASRNWGLLLSTSVLAYGSLLFWLLYFVEPTAFPSLIALSEWLIERQLIYLSALIFLLVCSFPFIIYRREVHERISAGMTLVLSSVGYFIVTSWLTDYLGEARLLIALLTLMILYWCFAYLSWLRHHRLSYAKYFLFLSLVAFILAVYLFLMPATISLFWFIASVVVISIGFILNSYTARWVGLASLALTGVHYLAVILPNDAVVSGPVWLHDRVWLGAVFILYLCFLANWFKGATLQGNEKRFVPVLASVFYTVAGFLAFALITYEAYAPTQTVLWILLGLMGIFTSPIHRTPLLTSIGFGLVLVTVVKLFLVDALAFDQNGRIAALAAFAVVLILAASLTHRYRAHWRRFFRMSV